MTATQRGRFLMPLTLVLAATGFGPEIAPGQRAIAETPFEKRVRTDIKNKISYKKDKTTTWYVIQLQEVTVTSISSKSISYRSTVVLKKVQGQDAAVKFIYDWVTGARSGTKTYYSDAFPDTDKGKKGMVKHMADLDAMGKLKGYRPRPE